MSTPLNPLPEGRIKNEVLRQNIVHHYNVQQKQIERSVSVSEHLSNENLVYFFDRVYPEITLDFQETFDVDNEFWVPENYSMLLKDQTLIPKISHNIKVRYRFSKLLKAFVKEQKSLVKEIDKELSTE